MPTNIRIIFYNQRFIRKYFPTSQIFEKAKEWTTHFLEIKNCSTLRKDIFRNDFQSTNNSEIRGHSITRGQNFDHF